MRGHCLFWAVDSGTHIPDWVKEYSGQELVDLVQHRIDTTVPLFQVFVYKIDMVYSLLLPAGMDNINN